MLELQLRH